MINTTSVFYCVIGYLGLFVAGVFAFGLLRIKRRKERTPLPFKLLRAPGETLRRKIVRNDDQDVLVILPVAMAPVIVSGSILYLIGRIAPATPLNFALCFAGLVFVAGVFFAGKYVLGRLNRARHNWLGYMGERVVGETLLELCRTGYFVFHDVPADGVKTPFNLDHVVVGPSGVWLIETKTRRKGRARPGFKDHEVTFDGTKLVWPWGEDRHGIEQARAEAEWLTRWINQVSGLSVSAKPILVLPGWYVHEKALGPIRVLNQKNLYPAIASRKNTVLSEEEIDRIARQLDQRCRDVED